VGKPQQFTKEFKLEAVRLLKQAGRPAAEIAPSWASAENSSASGGINWSPRRGGISGPWPAAWPQEEIARLRQERELVKEECDILKKSRGSLCQGVPVKYTFVSAHQAEFTVSRMWAVLAISRSGFYTWTRRPERPHTEANRVLVERMRVLHQQTREAYGARKMWQLLRREGLPCGRHRVARLRRLAGIVALRRRRYVRTMQARHEVPVIPNRLARQFTVPPKNRVWAGDLTFVPTRVGWLYLTVALDVYSRLVVGWAMSDRQSLTVVIEARGWPGDSDGRPPDCCITLIKATSTQRVSIRRC
jgi:transposase-like protein